MFYDMTRILHILTAQILKFKSHSQMISEATTRGSDTGASASERDKEES